MLTFWLRGGLPVAAAWTAICYPGLRVSFPAYVGFLKR
jgi:hypothetical protein